MNDITINNSNVTILNRCSMFKKRRANELFNLSSWGRCVKIGNLRFYLTWNLRLKRRNKRDILRCALQVPKCRHKTYELAKGKCEICGKEITFKEMELHHVLPLGRFRHLATEQRNMQCLCHECHKEIHCNPYKNIRQIEAKAKELGINLKDYYGE